MNINVKDLVTLSDQNKYVVVSKIEVSDKVYFYLVDINNYENILICYLENNKLKEVKDEELVKQLIKVFSVELKDEIKNIMDSLNK